MTTMNHFIISFRSILSRSKASKVGRFPIHSDTAFPLPHVFIPTHSSIAAFAGRPRSRVALVLRARGLAQILSSIVECVMVPVVSFFDRDAIKDFTCHPNACFAVVSVRVKTSGVWIPVSAPIPLAEPIKISGIDDGVLSLSQRNQTIGLVLRLDDCMTFHAVFSHRFTSNGLMLPAAF